MHRLVCGLRLASLDAGHTPLNNKTPAMATDRLLCAPPCVCTALYLHRLVYAPPCMWTTAPFAQCGDTPAPPLNNKTPAVATDRLLCAPPCVCTPMYVHGLVCGLRASSAPPPWASLVRQTPLPPARLVRNPPPPRASLARQTPPACLVSSTPPPVRLVSANPPPCASLNEAHGLGQTMTLSPSRTFPRSAFVVTFFYVLDFGGLWDGMSIVRTIMHCAPRILF